MDVGIASIGWHRPEMQDLQLEYLSRARGSSDIPVHLFIDGGGMRYEQAKILTDRYCTKFKSAELSFRAEHAGLSRHILKAMESMFDKYDYVCLMEDDVMVAHDFFEYHMYIQKNFDLREMNIFSVCGYSKQGISYKVDVGPEEALHLRTWYVPDAVMFTRHVWETTIAPLVEPFLDNPMRTLDSMRAKCAENNQRFERKTWETGKHNSRLQAGFLNTIRASKGMRTIHPERSRAQDIGHYGANHPQKTNKGEDIRDPEFWKLCSWSSSCFRMDAKWDKLEVVSKEI